MRTIIAAILLGLLFVASPSGCGGGGGGGGGAGGQPADPNADGPNGDGNDPVDLNALDLGGGVTLGLVEIAAGSFVMGSPEGEAGRLSNEGPQRTVAVSAFRMAQTAVTVAQWHRFTQESGYNFSREDGLSGASPGEEYPVVFLTYADAQAFCDWLSDRSGREVSLPTEAQWEYACRAGTVTRFNYGDAESHDNMNFEGTGGLDQFEGNAPVRSFPPNTWGLYDMHGGVLEHCRDWYDPGYYAGRPNPDADPLGPASGDLHVLRGGGWYSEAFLCRSAVRGGDTSLFESGRFGFRVVVEGD